MTKMTRIWGFTLGKSVDRIGAPLTVLLVLALAAWVYSGVAAIITFVEFIAWVNR